jgi:hypothetical protein
VAGADRQLIAELTTLDDQSQLVKQFFFLDRTTEAITHSGYLPAETVRSGVVPLGRGLAVRAAAPGKDGYHTDLRPLDLTDGTLGPVVASDVAYAPRQATPGRFASKTMPAFQTASGGYAHRGFH